MRILLSVLIGVALCGCSSQKNFQEAERATDEFHMQMAKGNYGGIYDASGPAIRETASRDQFISMLQGLDHRLGACGAAERKGFNVNYNTGGAFVAMVYSRKCANTSLEERFDWRIEGGRASLHGYHFKSGV
ncbi:MAG: hypothetical protein ACXV8X_06750 [Candidatus Angelobacter sp.]